MKNLSTISTDKLFIRGVTVFPFIFIFAVILGPLVYSLIESFSNYNIYRPHLTQYIGLTNYFNILQDSRFWESMRVTVLYTILTTLLPTLYGLFLAIVVNTRDTGREVMGKSIMRILFLVPLVMSETVFASFTRVYFWSTHMGLMTFLVRQMGMTPPVWLVDRSSAFFVTVITYTMIYFPLAFIVFDAGIRGVPREFYEAGMVEGAGGWKTFTKITLPAIVPQLSIVLILTITRSWRLFDLIWIMTKGGPARSTQVLSLYTYFSFMRYGRFGYASALSWVMIISLGLICATILWLLQKRVFAFRVEK